MHKYFKELDMNGNIIGQCSITYRDKEYLDEYIQEYPNAVEITEKEYDQIRKKKTEGFNK